MFIIMIIEYSQVMFEFRSLLYSKLGNLLFDEVARTMAAAFETRCAQVYGQPILQT